MCVYGAPPEGSDWPAQTAERMQPDVGAETFVDAKTPGDVLRQASRRYPGEHLVLVRADVRLPPLCIERLLNALELEDVLVVSPLDNVDPRRSPLAVDGASTADATTIDALCHLYGRPHGLDWDSFSPLLSAWNGAALNTLDLDKIEDTRLPAIFGSWRALLLEQLYVADPARDLRGPPAPAGDIRDAPPPSPLGELRQSLSAALAQPEDTPSGYPGLDAKPVVLHILHGWGGGSERFVRDLATGDTERHHLVMIARGNFKRRRYGEVLELFDASLSRPPLRRLYLPDPIVSTAFANRDYRTFLDDVCHDYRVDSIMVSSLIGHSLDALRSKLPTLYFTHDFYPLWPLLHRNLDDASLTFDAAQLRSDLEHIDAGFEFTERDPDYWLALRDAFAAAMLQTGVQLVAPARTTLDLFLRLYPRLASLPTAIVAHGIRKWTLPVALPLPAPPRRERLRLIVLGRIRGGKSANLLRQLVPALTKYAELFLIGAGAEGHEFFGRHDVHILLNYRWDELPEILAGLAPDAALILPDFAETFSYTLSELSSLGIPVIATRLGALRERVRDGVDGFLTDADPKAILDAVSRLCRNRKALGNARQTLAHTPTRTLADMVADYRELLPTTPGPRPASRLAETGVDRLVAQTRADEISARQRKLGALREDLATKQAELDKRAAWGFDLNKQLKRAAESARSLREEFDARSAWAARMNAELQTLRPQFEQVREERDLMRNSLSWRLTKPLRYLKRKLLGLRTRTAFSLAKLRAVFHRTRGSLANRGLHNTLRRIVEEFRRPVPLSAPVVTASPDEGDKAFEPFAVPHGDKPRASIVIPVFNNIAFTCACLRSLAEHAGETPFETIVVDDASSDETPQRLKQIDGIRLIRNAENLGFVGSCNAGAEIARGDFIVFLNNDTVVTQGWLEALLNCFAEEPDAGLVGAKLVYADGRLQEAGGIVFNDATAWNYGRFDDPRDPRYSFRRQVDYCSGAAIMIKRELFKRIGGFDKRYAPAYYEDTDLAFAVRAAGAKVFYEPRAIVVHFEGTTAGTDTGSGIKQHQVLNQEKLYDKWQHELATHPAPVHETKQVRRAANWRARGRILIVDAYTPQPDQDSGSLRMVNLMRLLRELDYAVSFLPDNRAYDGSYSEALQVLGVEVLYHPYVSNPVAWLRERGTDLDAVVLSRHYVAMNYVGPVRLYAAQARLIFDTVDLHFLREQRGAELTGSAELAQQAAHTRNQELKLIRECDVTLVVSDIERELLEREVPCARIEILSNVHEIHGCRRDFEQRRDLVFVGGFQHPPNADAVLWFVKEVFPLLRRKLPELNFHVIGSRAPAQILELAHDGVIVHGYVENIEPFMDGSRVCVAPLRYGAGIKGKVNMAMSYGLPVVATRCAVEGMHVNFGEKCDNPDVLVADSPEQFAAAVVRAHTDARLWKTLSDNGLVNVRRHFSFDTARTGLSRILPEPNSSQTRNVDKPGRVVT